MANKAKTPQVAATVSGAVTIQIPPISVVVHVPVPSSGEIIKNKDLWRIVVYCSLLEFYAKIRLQRFFEGHGIKSDKWLHRLDKYPLDRVRQMLVDLDLVEKSLSKKILRVEKARNHVVHEILVSAMIPLSEEADEVTEIAEQCIRALTRTRPPEKPKGGNQQTARVDRETR